MRSAARCASSFAGQLEQLTYATDLLLERESGELAAHLRFHAGTSRTLLSFQTVIGKPRWRSSARFFSSRGGGPVLRVQSGSELTIDTLVRGVSDEGRRPCNSVRRTSALNGSDAAIARQRARQTALNIIAVCGTVQS
jgi:hypothetical protein